MGIATEITPQIQGRACRNFAQMFRYEAREDSPTFVAVADKIVWNASE